MKIILKGKKCLHILAHKKKYLNGETLVCSKCKTVMRFTNKNGTMFMFPLGGSMTTESKNK